MEDISGKKRVPNRRGLGVVASFVAVGVFVSATWLSSANKDSTGSAQVQFQLDAVGNSIDHLAGQPGTERPANNSTAGSIEGITPDDDVDIALGGSWRNDDCTNVTVQVLKASTNELVDALDCQRSSPKPIHAYEAYSNEALESLAYSDPIAALVLGRRLALLEPESTWDLMIRSSALLGGDTRPVRWLATHSFNQVRTASGEVATDTMQRRYVLDSVARKLENNPDQSFDFREYYLRGTLTDAEFDRLDRRVDALLDQMKVIEEERTGNNTFEGDV